MESEIIGELQLIFKDEAVFSKPIYIFTRTSFTQEMEFLSQIKSRYSNLIFKEGVFVRKIITKPNNRFYRKEKFFLFPDGDTILDKNNPLKKVPRYGI